MRPLTGCGAGLPQDPIRDGISTRTQNWRQGRRIEGK